MLRCAPEKVRDTHRIDRYFSEGMDWRKSIVSVGDPSGMYLADVSHYGNVYMVHKEASI